MLEIRLGKNQERRIRQGHLWVFSNEILQISGEKVKGALCKVSAFGGGAIGYGFYHPGSLIAIRMLSSSFPEDVAGLICKRIEDASEMRKKMFPGRRSYRLVFGESDFLPGLVIDKYNDTYVLQVHSAGMEPFIADISDFLRQRMNAVAVLTKHDYYLRSLEVLPAEDENLFGDAEEQIISDGELSFCIDFNAGQKTGFYFDQVINRKAALPLCKDAIVWDIFCNSGGFGMYAMKGGAKFVEFVDSSAAALSLSEKNIALNAFSSPYACVKEDSFEFLKKKKASGEQADIIFLDPPAFAKNKKSIDTAVQGYTTLHKAAFNTIKSGGYIFFTSCSFHIDRTTFLQTIRHAAGMAGRKYQIIISAGAAPDHPIHPAMPESEYLKFIGIRVFD